MRRFLVSSLVCAGFAVLAGSTSTYSAGCVLDNAILNCRAEGRTADDIMKVFTSQETRNMLANPLMEKQKFKQNGDLEKYRASMEKNWLVITRLARKKERDVRAKRISNDEYRQWTGNFKEAEKSYSAALNFYRQLHWQGVK